MSSSRASLRELSSLSRNLGVSLHSGIGILRAFELAARKTSGRLHQVLENVILDIKAGQDITSSLETHDRFFPKLFIDMVRVGEATGSLPEVLKALGEHYENTLRLRKDFIGRIIYPAGELTAAIVIIAGLIYILGWIAETTGRATDVLGWGLLGTGGALIWLGGWAMLAAGGFVAYQMLSSSLASRQSLDRLILSLPVVGHCARSFAIARFSWAFHLTQQTGMPIDDSLDASLRATGNGAFAAAAPTIIADVSAGETLTDALERSGLFPVEFIEYVMVAEQAGTVPEALDRMSPQFEEDARRSLQAMATALSWGVRATVAAIIAFIVFTIALWYIGMLNDAANEAMR